MEKTRMVIVVLVWLSILACGALVYKWVVVPAAEKTRQEEEAKAKQDLLRQTGSDSGYQYEINLGLDSFSGYAVLRSKHFKNLLYGRGVKLNLQDDGADYGKRLKGLQSGELQMAVFTIDGLVKASAEIDDLPATIVSIIDETNGTDAMVAPKKVVTSIDSLSDPDTIIVLTPNTPSETLTRLVMANFKVNVPQDRWVKKNSAKEVYETYKFSKPTDKKVFVLWEPYISKIAENPDYHVVIDSSKVRGYVVDVLVVSRDFLVKNEELVQDILKMYFRANYFYHNNMADLVREDSEHSGETLTGEQAKRIVAGVHWKNTLENYAHFGTSPCDDCQLIHEMIVNITNLLVQTSAISTEKVSGVTVRTILHTPQVLYFSRFMKSMNSENFHPGAEEIRKGEKLSTLTEEEWKKLMPVGTLQLPRLIFARGTARLTEASEETLSTLSKQMKTWPQYYLTVRGNCSKIGDVEANKDLANRRAKAVVNWLASNGVAKERLRAETSELNGSMSVSFVFGQVPY